MPSTIKVGNQTFEEYIQKAIETLDDLRKTLERDDFGMDQDLNASGKSIHSERGLYNSQYAKTLY